MDKQKQERPHQLSFELMGQVCSAIQDSGFVGSAAEYVREFYNKPFSELTTCEAEMLVRQLQGKEEGGE